MSLPWTERPVPNGVALDLVAVDGDARDAAELAQFKRALAEPEAAEARRTWILRPRTRSLRESVLVVLSMGIGALSLWLVTGVLSWLGWKFGEEAMIRVIFASFFLPAIVAAVLLDRPWRYLRRRRQPAQHPYTLTMDVSGLAVESDGLREQFFPLGAIDHLEGTGRLVVITTAGQREPLHCALTTLKEHSDLAARLNEALTEARADAGGYRGYLPCVDNDDDASAVERERRE
ncbi:MAG: hypothetical protein FWD69_05350 [Polyangiaceae bacterium]|nr:hypothetical protein [Polyangiaceae bacterium]